MDRHTDNQKDIRGEDAWEGFTLLSRAKPRDGFALRVMARLDEAPAGNGFARPPFYTGWAWPAAAALLAVALLFAAFRLPEPAWMDTDRSLSAWSAGSWSDGGAFQTASLTEENHD